MADLPRFVLRDDQVEATIDPRVYRLAAIKKAAYRLASRCTVVLGPVSEDAAPIAFRFKPATSEASALEAVRAFFEELLDQELREQIGEETAPLRALILAQAFSKTDLIRRDE